jgi:hypothetical protein
MKGGVTGPPAHEYWGYEYTAGRRRDTETEQDMALKDAVLQGIASAVTTFYQNANPPLTPAQLAKEIQVQQYKFEFGNLVVDQNPYAKPDDLEPPTRFPTGTGETRLIRRAGLLREHHADDPLPVNRPIPGGPVYRFTYENLASLDDLLDATEVPGGMGGDDLNKVGDYAHHIVKAVRIRYRIKTRKFINGPLQGQPHIAHVIILYSGGETH